MAKVKVAYMSDLHLEFGELQCELPSADVLILAGDIGHPLQPNLERFLSKVGSLYYRVLYVPGNHEYYGLSIQQGNELLESMCKRCKVIFLNNKFFQMYVPDEEPICFVGTTLWSWIPPEYDAQVQEYMGDFKLIKEYSPSVHRRMFLDNYAWLRETIPRCKRVGRVVVITHHAPLTKGTSAFHFEGQPTTTCFSSDCSELIQLGVDKWIFGHTHFSTQMKLDTCEILSNPKGYGSNGKKEWDPKRHFIQ